MVVKPFPGEDRPIIDDDKDTASAGERETLYQILVEIRTELCHMRDKDIAAIKRIVQSTRDGIG